MGYIIRRKLFSRAMCQRKYGQRKGLRKMRRRAVKSWNGRCPSVRRRRRCVRGALLLMAAGTLAWAVTGRGVIRWVREQIPCMERIEQSGPAGGMGEDGMTSVKRGFTIRLDEKKIHIFQVEEGYENRGKAGASGSD